MTTKKPDQFWELDLFNRGAKDCGIVLTKPITTKHQSMFWLVSQSWRMSAIYVGTCRWLSLAVASAQLCCINSNHVHSGRLSVIAQTNMSERGRKQFCTNKRSSVRDSLDLSMGRYASILVPYLNRLADSFERTNSLCKNICVSVYSCSFAGQSWLQGERVTQ